MVPSRSIFVLTRNSVIHKIISVKVVILLIRYIINCSCILYHKFRSVVSMFYQIVIFCRNNVIYDIYIPHYFPKIIVSMFYQIVKFCRNNIIYDICIDHIITRGSLQGCTVLCIYKKTLYFTKYWYRFADLFYNIDTDLLIYFIILIQICWFILLLS